VDRVVVVGAGLAGARTCQQLRARGYAGELVLVGAEARPPYDRPPLSKRVLLGEVDDSSLDPNWYGGAELRLGVTATGLEPGMLATTHGELRWDGLALATGAVPRRIGGDRIGGDRIGGDRIGGDRIGGDRAGGDRAGGDRAGGDRAGACVLRTADDSLRLRAAFVPGARVVIVGAGWIGAEVATAAARRGCAVTVLEAAAAPLSAALGEEVGARTIPWYAEAGVTLRAGEPVSGLDGAGVTLSSGEVFPADVVVEGIGVRPDLGWLAGSEVEVDPRTGGVVVDASCRASLPGVVAVGDCAARYSPRTGQRIRTEHWDDALRAPEVAAAALLGEEAIYDPVPYVWSEQLGRYLQWAGWRDGPPSVWRGDPARDRAWAAAWLDAEGRLTGFLAVDRPRDAVQARRAIDAGRVPDPARLADPGVPVRDA
jgi:3-phenylpropionate/trans-cinnamate dioxygenase ferredoxin reductase subunit